MSRTVLHLSDLHFGKVDVQVLEPLVDAFEQLGLRVPADLSITALCPDDVAAALPVPVTSIAIPAAEVGEQAVALLMKKLSGTPVPEATLLPPRLTVRASTARRVTA